MCPKDTGLKWGPCLLWYFYAFVSGVLAAVSLGAGPTCMSHLHPSVTPSTILESGLSLGQLPRRHLYDHPWTVIMINLSTTSRCGPEDWWATPWCLCRSVSIAKAQCQQAEKDLVDELQRGFWRQIFWNRPPSHFAFKTLFQICEVKEPHQILPSMLTNLHRYDSHLINLTDTIAT